MASDTQDIEPPEGDGAGAAAVAAAVAAGAACLSCGVAIVGVYCVGCGQKNDDLRRSSFVLFKDFIRETFAFDSRMWRTLGLLAAAPGTVPRRYSHGKRSSYTPPVRLFLVVSFLFFLVLGFTQTMFLAVEVRALTPQEIAADRALKQKAATLAAAGASSGAVVAKIETDGGIVEFESQTVDCDIKFATRFFVRASDLKTDPEAWRRCADSIDAAAKVEI